MNDDVNFYPSNIKPYLKCADLIAGDLFHPSVDWFKMHEKDPLKVEYEFTEPEKTGIDTISW